MVIPTSSTFVNEVLQGDCLALYMFIICLDFIIWTLIDLIKESCFTLKKKKKKDMLTIFHRKYDGP